MTTAEEVDEMEVEELRRLSKRLLRLNSTLKTEIVGHNEYRDRVRAKAIEVAEEQGWCRSGLNDALNDLGLKPLKSKVTATVKISEMAQRTGEVEVEVEVDDPSDEDQIQEAAFAAASEEWEHDRVTWDDWEDHDLQDEDYMSLESFSDAN